MILMAVTACLAYATGNSFFFIILAMMFGLLSLSWLVCYGMVKGIEVSRVYPDRVYASWPFRVLLTVRNTKRWLPSFALGFTDKIQTHDSAVRGRSFVLSLANQSELKCDYQVNIFKRGRHQFQYVRVTTRFPFGFFRCNRKIVCEESIVVYPEMGDVEILELMPQRAVEHGAVPTRLSGHDNFRSLREYRSGDNTRLIHWRVSARADKLMLKEMDREQMKNFTVVLDTNVDAVSKRYRRHLLERGVSFAATIVQKLSNEGYGVEFLAFAPEFCQISAGSNRRQLQLILDHLALLEAGKHSLDAMLPLMNKNKQSIMFILKLSTQGCQMFESHFPLARGFQIDSPEVRNLFRRRSLLRNFFKDASQQDI